MIKNNIKFKSLNNEIYHVAKCGVCKGFQITRYFYTTCQECDTAHRANEYKKRKDLMAHKIFTKRKLGHYDHFNDNMRRLNILNKYGVQVEPYSTDEVVNHE